MKTLIIFESTHHGNTKKLVDAIAEKYEVDIINATDCEDIDYGDYDLIGFASGIAYSKFYNKITTLAHNLQKGKKVFFIYSCANNSKDFSSDIRSIAEACGCVSVGTYGCKGYNTYGPFKLVGGINKKHPDADEIQGAVAFYELLLNK